MAAAKKSSGVGTALTIGAAIVGAYLLYRWFMGTQTAQASSGAGYYPGTSGGASYGYGSGAAGTAQPGGLGNALRNLFQRMTGKGNGIGIGAGPSYGATPAQGSAAQTMAQLQQQIAAIGGFNTNAINLPTAELGGQSLATYSPDYTSTFGPGGLSIPLLPAPIGQLDLGGGNPVDLGSLSGQAWMNQVDNSSAGYASTLTDSGALSGGSFDSSGNFSFGG